MSFLRKFLMGLLIQHNIKNITISKFLIFTILWINLPNDASKIMYYNALQLSFLPYYLCRCSKEEFRFPNLKGSSKRCSRTKDKKMEKVFQNVPESSKQPPYYLKRIHFIDSRTKEYRWKRLILLKLCVLKINVFYQIQRLIKNPVKFLWWGFCKTI